MEQPAHKEQGPKLEFFQVQKDAMGCGRDL